MQNFISHKRLYINMTAIVNKRQLGIKLKLKKPPEKLAQRREVVLSYGIDLLTF